MGKREKLLPEITDEAGRRFLDIVPVVRKMREQIVSKQEIEGKPLVVCRGGREVRVLLYRAGEGVRPAIIHLHGGGFAFGSAQADDAYCAALCRQTACHVISVNYTLAPEAVFPAQLDETCAVIDYFRKEAAACGIDPDRIGLTGFSAGANLATATAMRLAEEGAHWLRAQVLHYPMLDQFKNAALLPGAAKKNTYIDPALVEGFIRFYSAPEERALPGVSPLYAGDEILKKMAPALIIAAEDDILRSEAEAYRDRIREAGGRVDYLLMQGVHHCYIEDTFNRALFEALTLETKKRALAPDFQEKAQEALRIAAEFFREALRCSGRRTLPISTESVPL